ncbi:MAG: hypothetical protein RLY35_1587 [Bacteroidota bacterium]|jgi:hypothetical protein
MKENTKKAAHFYGINFLQFVFSTLVALYLGFVGIGGIPELLDPKRMQIPVYFVFFDWVVGVFLFVLGVGASIQMRNKFINQKKATTNNMRKGLVLFLIGIVFIKWGMNLFIIVGSSFLISGLFRKTEGLWLHGLSLAIILISMVLINFDVPFRLTYFGLDFQNDGFLKLTSFLLFNGYYSLFPWVAIFLSGMAVGKGALRPRGFFPPSSLAAIIIIMSGVLVDQYCTGLYPQMDMYRAKFLYPFDQFVYQPSFMLFIIGISWLLINFVNHFFTFIHAEKTLNTIKDLSYQKFSILFFIYLFASIFIMGFAHSGTIIVGFSYTWTVVISVVILYLLIMFLLKLWKKKVNKYTPLEWLIKSVSLKNNSAS